MSAPTPEPGEAPPTRTVPAEAGADSSSVRRRARVGVWLLGARSVLQQLTILVANVYLTRTLKPADYGVFTIIQFALALFTLLGDAGLGTALIQKHAKPERSELSTIWWFQLGLSSAIVATTFVAAPFVLRFWPDLPEGSSWLLRGLALGLLFTMLRAVPMLLLERNLRYGWIGTLEFTGTVAFYGTAVIMASRGAGASSLVSASVCQSLALALTANLVQPFRPAWVFDRERLRSLLRFGFSFQGKNIVGFVNLAVTPLFAGARLGKEALGHVQFAQQVGYFPSLPVGIVSRVSFPLLSRLQQDRHAFANELERAVLLCGIPTFWFTGLVLGVGPALVSVVYSDKWLPALPALYVYTLTYATGFYFTVLGSALDAFGRPQVLFRLFVAVALVNWLCVTIATSVGHTPLAFALGYCVHVLVGNVAILVAVKQLLPIARPLARLGSPAVGAAVVALAGRAALPYTHSPVRLSAWVVLSLALFAAVVLNLDRSLWRSLNESIRKLARGKSHEPAK